MRLRVRHDIHYGFAEPARIITQVLRMTPRSHEGQHVIDWRIDVDADCALKAGEDGLGNLTHIFTVRGPTDGFTVSVAGEVETFDAGEVLRGSAERLPPELYLRSTQSTMPDTALREFVAVVAPRAGIRDRLQALMQAVRDAMTFDLDVVIGGTAAEAFATRRGNGGDLAQIFVTCARLMGCPARVTTGYYLDTDRQGGLRHSWAEVFQAGLGWIGFDPAHNTCPRERHIRVAAGLDGYAAASVRGTRTDGATVTLEVKELPAPTWSKHRRQI